ncbi:hypothetical protein FOXG_19067 [Fusarium oxysporum f. sp. lycopersici 4287]|uniref:Secreted protein n=2 Tax=Fusarium oxysporum TaxID=5507 RepID=A0A0J9UV39_FUSO4|nr:hypothetical protein FOXG_19067 [Fusarium oxysporum f. sp. lycopersici 4287]EXK39698.1 hypothetical protein FOMG_06898 [Fusarium oxysporum f. sp. melonis 26406]KNB02738.1 hypothetical protein FOXG_19067 [Fusarium oxysporum f. sp. lycopersici 4287]
MLSRLGTACDPLATLVYLFLTLVSLRSAGNAGSQSVQIEAKTSGFWVPYSTPSGAHIEEHHAVCVSCMRPINTYVPDPPSKLPLNNGKPIDKCRERTPISTTTGSSTNNASANVTRSIRGH